MSDPQVRFVPARGLDPVPERCSDCMFLRKDSSVLYSCTREGREKKDGRHGDKLVDPLWPACVAFRR